jgi:hypothetical protein
MYVYKCTYIRECYGDKKSSRKSLKKNTHISKRTSACLSHIRNGKSTNVCMYVCMWSKIDLNCFQKRDLKACRESVKSQSLSKTLRHWIEVCAYVGRYSTSKNISCYASTSERWFPFLQKNFTFYDPYMCTICMYIHTENMSRTRSFFLSHVNLSVELFCRHIVKFLFTFFAEPCQVFDQFPSQTCSRTWIKSNVFNAKLYRTIRKGAFGEKNV